MNFLPSLYEKAAKLNIPLKAQIELLSPCNLRCPHCYVTHSKRTKLTLPVLDNLFEEMEQNGAMMVTFTGGEIGLRKDLFQIIAAARKRNLAVQLFSTGTLWNEAEWDQVASLGVIQVQMSLYGVTSCVHDAVTLTDGSFSKTMRSARGLVERGVPVKFACPITKENAAEAIDVIELGEKLGIPVTIDPEIAWTDRSDDSPMETLASFQQLFKLFSDPRMIKRFAKPEDACDIPSDENRPCSVGNTGGFIDSQGDVLPCAKWPTKAGNIFEQRYTDIWRDSTEMNFARGLTYQDMTECRSCGDKGHCHACLAMNLKERGAVGRASQTICTATAAKTTAFYGQSQQTKKSGARLPIIV